jgi:UDP-glucose 4-epimerase
MNILITGGLGFIGSNLAKFYHKQGHNVVIIDDCSTNCSNNPEEICSHFINIGITSLPPAVLESQIKRADMIFHMACVVGVKSRDSNPYESFLKSQEADRKIVDMVSMYNPKAKFFYPSTSEVYGETNLFYPSEETDNFCIGSSEKFRWAYASTKIFMEFYVRAKLQNWIILRFFNISGYPQQSFTGMVLPRFVEAAKSGKPLTVYGDGNQIRSFCDVRDAVKMIDSIKNENQEVFNIGNDKNLIRISNLAEKVIELTESGSKINLIPFNEVYSKEFEEIYYRVPDISKISKFYAPKYSLDDIIKSMI